jgi:hypothetical protein
MSLIVDPARNLVFRREGGLEIHRGGVDRSGLFTAQNIW